MDNKLSRAERRAQKVRNQRLLLIAFLVIALGAVAAVWALGAQTKSQAELKIEDVQVGSGPAAQAGDTVTVNYTGWLQDGTEFDSSVGKQPYTFVLGQQQVIPGWDQGLVGMQAGGTRRLTIPPNLAYGTAGAGGGLIPPNATLVFEVELLAIQ
jgi:FKBP-type peptidyl-prolyl cis-trans isomerase